VILDKAKNNGIWIILFVAAVLRVYFYSGISSADDLAIAEASLDLLEGGPYMPTGHYNARLAMVYPLAGVFLLFGTGDWQMALLPMAASLVTIGLTFLIAKRLFCWQVGILAAAILAIFPLDVVLASRFVPDTYFGAYMTGAVYFALRAYDGGSKSLFYSLMAGLLWGAGYLVKIEAAFLLVPLLYLAWQNRALWRQSICVAVGCFVFVGGENIIYWSQTGHLFHRLSVVSATTVIKWNEAYSNTQLWVFPKAWFVTPYYFGLHYYLLFLGMFWWAFSKQKRLTFFVIWAGIYLVWLQFGFNPFTETVTFKSHLSRYCIGFGAPTAIIIAVFLKNIFADQQKLVPIFGGFWIVVSVILMAFNVLSNEREVASKIALAKFSGTPSDTIYMDNGTLGLATFLYRKHPMTDVARSFQQHDFITGKTRLVPVNEMDGYLILNREFVRHRKNRYFMAGLNDETIINSCSEVLTIDNPAPKFSYFVARGIKKILLLMPLDTLKNKAKHTVDSVLADRDVVIYDCRQS